MVITAGLGWLDWVTGHRLSFFAFYFIPVGMAAWRLENAGAVAASLVCAGVWFVSDTCSGAPHDSAVLTTWNTMMRLVAFLTIGWTLSRLHRILVSEKEKSIALERSLAENKLLTGFLPVCAQCKRIRNDEGAWQQMEVYISQHSEARFTHSYCPECAKEILVEAGISRP